MHEIIKTIFICLLIGIIGFTYQRELLKIEEIEKSKIKDKKIIFDDDIKPQSIKVIKGT